MGEEEIVLEGSNVCIFRYVQRLLAMGASAGRSERLRRIWEPTYMWDILCSSFFFPIEKAFSFTFI